MLLGREIELTPPSRRPLAGPFPNLRTREIVKGIAEAIVTTADHTSWNASELRAFAIGYVRGTLTTLQETGDDTSAMFAADLLQHVNEGGIDAVRELAEAVMGREVAALSPDSPDNDNHPKLQAAE